MELQNKIIKRYMKTFNEPTLREISENTGIQITRVFRILNGSVMKLNEYEIFLEKIQEKMGLQEDIYNTFEKCVGQLSAEDIFALGRKLEKMILINQSLHNATLSTPLKEGGQKL